MKVDSWSEEKIFNVELTGDDLRRLLRVGLEAELKISSGGWHKKYEFNFKVPTGGDYSGMTLKVDSENPVSLTITCSKTDKTNLGFSST